MSYINYLPNFQGTWSNSKQYNYIGLGTTLLNPETTTCFTPMVIYSGTTYVANGTKIPTLGTIPSSDTGWTALP